MVHWQARRLSSLLQSVYISCRPEQAEAYQGDFPLLLDAYPSGGPMSGLLTAMASSPGTAWLVLSVDMPFLSMAALQRLIRHRDEGRLATVYQQPDGILQPLASIWEPAARYCLQDAWQMERRSLRQVLEQQEVLVLDTDSGEDWANLNAPQDWARWRARTTNPDRGND